MSVILKQTFWLLAAGAGHSYCHITNPMLAQRQMRSDTSKQTPQKSVFYSNRKTKADLERAENLKNNYLGDPYNLTFKRINTLQQKKRCVLLCVFVFF